ncbi:IucA/IucC family protein [Streptomyces sp. NPDC049813]|uniref:IucA/IucC family protein n=1 Tax=Streptomyces sp. NPDC049813 TaxID=3365597 RepID=UPI0037AC4978
MPNPPVVPNPSAVPPPAESSELYDPPELTRENWERAGARLLAKLIGEFAYEEILRPLPVGHDADAVVTPGRRPYTLTVPSQEKADDAGTSGPGRDRTGSPHRDQARGPAGGPTGSPDWDQTLALADGATGHQPDGSDRHQPDGSDDRQAGHSAGGQLHFYARRGAYGSWQVEPDSIEWAAGPITTEGEAGSAHAPEPFTDPLAFLLRTRHLIGLDGATLGHLIRELSVTLAADARLDHSALTALQLADLGYADLEGHQTGHPWIVLNKGRLGFSATDTSRWAPEARRPTRLPWIAVHTSLATYRGAPGLGTADSLYSRELDPPTRRLFAESLRARGLDPAAYLYLPVHPWQWDDIVLPLFAHSVATDTIVPLPTDGDVRLPQQSIRTFLNTSRPERHTVKLPLSVLNTLVWRGLPTERTLAAPAVTTWMHAMREGDPFLRDECDVILLGEVASVAVQHPMYSGLEEVPYQYKELLGAIWREPVKRYLAPGERARTLASLLLVDPQGRAVTTELIARSGLDAKTWLRRLFAALLPPLLRFLYRYGTVFSPHGENAIVVFDEQDVPVRLAVKDFVDDVNVSATPLPEHDSMPQDVRDVLLTERPDFLTQFIHSGLFVGVFRYLAPLCEGQLGVPEAEFWALVRAEILRHHARFPELKERYELFDLLTPRIERLCLNRNRLHLDGYRDRAHRPHAAVHGTVANPLHQP